ncbi:MAG: LLM class flavin-dependent oxidoreductase [Solirubrobacteraceae bacterium]
MSATAIRDAPLRFGIRLLDNLGTPADLVELAVAAEEAGFDSVWFPHDTLRANSWVLAAAVAGKTTRIQIGSVGTNPWVTHPCEIATFAATLDALSNERLALGLGVHTLEHLEWVGVKVADHVAATREAYEIVCALLAGAPPPAAARFFPMREDGHLRFRGPRPQLPIYITAFGHDYLRLSGEIGHGSMPMVTPPESASLMLAPIREGMQAAGRNPGSVDIAGLAWISVSEDGGLARDRMADVVAYFGAYLEPEALDTIGLGPADFGPARDHAMRGDHQAARKLVTDRMLRLGIAGAPEDCVEPIQKLAADGVTNIVLGGPLGPDPEHAIRLLGARVLPECRS